MVAVLRWHCLAVLALLVTACTSSLPYRTTENKTKECPRDTAATECRWLTPKRTNITPERTNEYELHFVEFDDQGWLHPNNDTRRGEAYRQLHILMRRLREMSEMTGELSIVVYVHGWKHNAKSDDADVRKFRVLLSLVRKFEIAVSQDNPRKVVGIYVGWRGKSLDIGEPFLNITFWDRKGAALRVAQGSVRELFSRLNGLQRHKNWDCAIGTAASRPRCKIRMLLIGHSFGAWILYSAIAESLIEALSAEKDVKEQPRSVTRFADLVVLINPAFEASAYEPLHHASKLVCNATYQAPIFVSVTSTADWATKYAFPAGRFFSTIFQRPTSSPDQSEAISNTPGHIDRYITHELEVTKSKPAACNGWNKTIDPCDLKIEDVERNIKAEKKNRKNFFSEHGRTNGGLSHGWRRTFCGGMTLRHLNGQESVHPHSLVWNVRTNKQLIPSHTDITEHAFLGFVRQLYHDVTERPPQGPVAPCEKEQDAR